MHIWHFPPMHIVYVMIYSMMQIYAVYFRNNENTSIHNTNNKTEEEESGCLLYDMHTWEVSSSVCVLSNVLDSVISVYFRGASVQLYSPPPS